MRFVNIQLHAQVDLQNSAEARFKNNEWCTKVVHWHALYTQHIHARTGWKKAHTFLLVVLIGIGQSWRSTGTNKYSKRTQKIKASCCFFVFFLRHEIFRVAYKKIHTHTKKVVSNSNRLGICCCYFCLFNSKRSHAVTFVLEFSKAKQLRRYHNYYYYVFVCLFHI